MKNNSIITLNISILTLIVVVYILHIWASLIIPFIIAILLSFAIISLSNFFQSKKINRFFSFLFSLSTFIIIFILIWSIIDSNINEIINLAPKYQERIKEIITPLIEPISQRLNSFWIDLDIFTQIAEENISEEIISETNTLKKWLFELDIKSILLDIAIALQSILSVAWIIFFYVLFILLEHRYFSKKLENMFTSETKKKNLFSILNHIKNDIKSYFLIKTLTSLTTASLSYIVLIIAGADFALFWSLLIFLLNFIPTIGSIIAVSFPLVFTFVQFGFSPVFVTLLLFLIWIQIAVWNILEPKFMWNKLNLSPLVIILSLWFWWSIWWIIWMLLSVPIMVIINIVLSHIDSTRWIAVMLSEKWELNPKFSIQHKKKKKHFWTFKERIQKYYTK